MTAQCVKAILLSLGMTELRNTELTTPTSMTSMCACHASTQPPILHRTHKNKYFKRDLKICWLNKFRKALQALPRPIGVMEHHFT